MDQKVELEDEAEWQRESPPQNDEENTPGYGGKQISAQEASDSTLHGPA